MTGRWKYAASVLVATGALALASGGSASAAPLTALPTAPTNGATLVLTSAGLVRTFDFGRSPQALGLPAGVAAEDVQPQFELLDGGADQQWTFTQLPGSQYFQISPVLNPTLCLTSDGVPLDEHNQTRNEQVLLQSCAGIDEGMDNQLWSYAGSGQFSTRWDADIHFNEAMGSDANGDVVEQPNAHAATETFPLYSPTPLVESSTVTIAANENKALAHGSCPSPYLAAGPDLDHPAFQDTDPTDSLTASIVGNAVNFDIYYAKSAPVAVTGGITWTCVLDARPKRN